VAARGEKESGDMNYRVETA